MIAFFAALLFIFSSFSSQNSEPVNSAPVVDPIALSETFDASLTYDDFVYAMEECEIQFGDTGMTQDCMVLLADTYPTYGEEFFDFVTNARGYVDGTANRFYTIQDTGIDPGVL